MEIKVEGLKEQVDSRLARGGVIATGIGAFAVVYHYDSVGDDAAVLLRRRKEKESIIYQKDLSGKWEVPGGGMKLSDLVPGQDGYLGSIVATVRREAMEEAGLDLASWNFAGAIYPAILAKDDDKQSLIDFAFSVPIEWQDRFATDEFEEKYESGELRWVDVEDLEQIDIVSSRMRFIISLALETVLAPCDCKCIEM